MSSQPRDQYLAVCEELQRVVAERDAALAAEQAQEPVGYISKTTLENLTDPKWRELRNMPAELWTANEPPSRAIIPVYLHPAPEPTQELSWGERLHRNLNGLGEDDHDKRAEHFMQQCLDGLTVGPLNRNSIKAALAEQFADCAHPPPTPMTK
jgi:hypothetical protein